MNYKFIYFSLSLFLYATFVFNCTYTGAIEKVDDYCDVCEDDIWLDEATIKNYSDLVRNGTVEKVLELEEKNALIFEVNLRDIVEKAYRKDQMKNVIQFTENLSACLYRKIAIPSIYELMKENNQSDSFEALVLNTLTLQSECIQDSEFKSKLKEDSDRKFDYLSNQIRESNYTSILDFARAYNSTFYSHYLEKIVDKIYDNKLENFSSVLNFSQALNRLEKSFNPAYSILLNRMKINNHLGSDELMILAYQIKKLMEGAQFSELPDSSKETFENLKKELPKAVRDLLWKGNNCRIKITRFEEYLYATEINYAYDNDRRSVMTWKPGKVVKQANWKFTPVENKDDQMKDAVSFEILNLDKDEYLFASNISHSVDIPQSRDFQNNVNKLLKGHDRVFTWRPKGNIDPGYWRITPWHDGERFVIYNLNQKKRLWSNDISLLDPESRRHVFSLDKFDANNTLGEWSIECQSVD